MRLRHAAAGAAVLAAMLAAMLAGGARASSLPMDAPIKLGNVETVCTGIGEGKNDPRWHAYPVRVEFVDVSARYIAGAHVSLSDVAGAPLAEFDCSGSWVLLKLPPGLYTVSARLTASTAAPAVAKFQPPQTGQTRVVLRFPAQP
jgi:hypothetical protein